MTKRKSLDRRIAEYHVGRPLTPGVWRITYRGKLATPAVVVSGDYARASMAERSAYAKAIRDVGKTGDPVLVSGPSGAFVVSAGTYPQEVDR